MPRIAELIREAAPQLYKLWQDNHCRYVDPIDGFVDARPLGLARTTYVDKWRPPRVSRAGFSSLYEQIHPLAVTLLPAQFTYPQGSALLRRWKDTVKVETRQPEKIRLPSRTACIRLLVFPGEQRTANSASPEHNGAGAKTRDGFPRARLPHRRPPRRRSRHFLLWARRTTSMRATCESI